MQSFHLPVSQERELALVLVGGNSNQIKHVLDSIFEQGKIQIKIVTDNPDEGEGDKICY